MVVICNSEYSNTIENNIHFDKYPYELSSFQKHAIDAILNNHHVLITAHTGSGKTLPAEFAIEHWVSQGKKVIYTSPIKALSNQKFFEFTTKYPHISFGLFTGDIKTNPEADVLIMTTEILMNRLFNDTLLQNKNLLQFQMDFETELAAVIFDEVHYINDADRGQVWEKTILMLPAHVQMIMLSATMDKPDRFAAWIENSRKNASTDKNENNKQVYVCPTEHRVVPLSHYVYMTMGEHEFKQIGDKSEQAEMRKLSSKPILIKDSKGTFNNEGYIALKRVDNKIQNQHARITRKYVLNNLVKHMRDNDMLPAICFVFSRKAVESCAKDITVPVLEDDSKIPYEIERETRHILRRLPNYEEYMRLPEFIELSALLSKGIGIHHSGMIPILREMVELFISKKYIKVLFATESFAIGLDCPIKTCVFTGITKFDGNNHRILHSHEYTQMAGRAGRRGIDKVGYVIHCNNMFRTQPTETEYKLLMGGKPPALISKFRMDYSLVLNVLKNSDKACSVGTVCEFIQKSMMNEELLKEISEKRKDCDIIAETVKAKLRGTECYKTPKDVCDAYRTLTRSTVDMCQAKKRAQVNRELKLILDDHPSVVKDIESWTALEECNKECTTKNNNVARLQQFVPDQVQRICQLLELEGFLKINGNEEITATENGTICSHVAEVHGPIWVRCMVDKWNYFEEFSCKQLVGLFSCAAGVRVDEEFVITSKPQTNDLFLCSRLMEMKEMYDRYEMEEDNRDIRTGIQYSTEFSFSIVGESMEWCDCHTEEECKQFIVSKLNPKGISLGDFTKAILKIATIAKELRGLYELPCCNTQTEWLYKLTQIEDMILKYIATNQSLYV
jgi:superfamily II RNA helicase